MFHDILWPCWQPHHREENSWPKGFVDDGGGVGVGKVAEGREGWGSVVAPFAKENRGAGHKQSFIPKPAILTLNMFCQASLQYRLK